MKISSCLKSVLKTILTWILIYTVILLLIKFALWLFITIYIAVIILKVSYLISRRFKFTVDYWIYKRVLNKSLKGIFSYSTLIDFIFNKDSYKERLIKDKIALREQLEKESIVLAEELRKSLIRENYKAERRSNMTPEDHWALYKRYNDAVDRKEVEDGIKEALLANNETELK